MLCHWSVAVHQIQNHIYESENIGQVGQSLLPRIGYALIRWTQKEYSLDSEIRPQFFMLVLAFFLETPARTLGFVPSPVSCCGQTNQGSNPKNLITS